MKSCFACLLHLWSRVPFPARVWTHIMTIKAIICIKQWPQCAVHPLNKKNQNNEAIVKTLFSWSLTTSLQLYVWPAIKTNENISILPVKTISGILEGVLGVVRVEFVVLGYCIWFCNGDVLLKYPGSWATSWGQFSSVC